MGGKGVERQQDLLEYMCGGDIRLGDHRCAVPVVHRHVATPTALVTIAGLPFDTLTVVAQVAVEAKFESGSS